MNLSWLAEIVFFGSYFAAWLTNKDWIESTMPHPGWVAISAIAALIVAIALLLFNGLPYVQQRQAPPQ